MVCVQVAFHENDGNHENDENDEDNSDSYKQGIECWIRGNHGNHENDENHWNPGCKPRVPQTTGLEIPDNRGRELNTNFFFSNFSGTAVISWDFAGISRQRVWFPWVSKDIPNFFWPPPIHVEDPHPNPKYPDQKVWVWVPFPSLI